MAATGGRQGGGAVLTPSGERIIALYRSIEDIAHVRQGGIPRRRQAGAEGAGARLRHGGHNQYASPCGTVQIFCRLRVRKSGPS